MKKLLPLLFALAFFACRQAYMPETKEVKEFFEQMDNGVLTQKMFLLVNKIPDDEGEHKYFKKYYANMDTILSEGEIESIFRAMADSRRGVWTNKFFDSAKIVSKAYIKNFVRQNQNCKPPAYFTFSLSWFSNDKRYCVFYYEHYCGGLCGEWSLRLYKKINGRWVFVKYYDDIVS